MSTIQQSSTPIQPGPKTEKPIKTTNISLPAKEKLALLSNLSTMIAAGIPILDSVESLLEDSKGNQRKFLLVLKDDLNQGQHLYATFEKFPRIFDKVAVNIVKASEEAGTLDIALNDVKEGIVKDMEFSDKIRSALMYPVFIMFVFLGVMLMILVVVVPKISSVFSRLSVELPLPTKIMIWMSNTLINYTFPVILGTMIVIALIVLLYKKQRHVFISLIFKMPLISGLVKKIDLTRFSHSLHLLLNAGIPITSALELTEQVVLNKDIKRAIRRTRDLVSSGKKLSEGFKEAKTIFPGIMIRVTEAGEKTGSLEKAMKDTSEYLDSEVTSALKTATALLEPIMLVVVGVMIGGMMLAIIAPIYSLIGSVGAR
jgi:type II secretory pathway component PulF